MIRTSCKKTKAAVAALLALVLLLGSSFGAFAIGSYGDENYALIDEANIFTDEQMTSLCDKLSAAGSKTDWQLAVVTTNDNVSSSRMDKYYNNYYDNNRNVFEADCVMFVIDNASSNRIILTHGTAESYFTDERLTEMKSALKPSLASGDMVSAVQIFADTSVSFYEQGIPSDGHHSNHVEGKSEEQLASEREKKSNKFLWTLTHWGWLFGLIALAGGGIFAGVNVGRYK
ncbi:MAG: TPM domain-containing protein, partial [Ruminococcus sp.]|nr:TPM domain-containing protein [Ruminococcus sp.]